MNNIVKFEWDEKKNQTNIEDHGVSFEKQAKKREVYEANV